ncbi:MAG: hypothetical protein ACUVYA_19430 [Planctomycetota bacterium]
MCLGRALGFLWFAALAATAAPAEPPEPREDSPLEPLGPALRKREGDPAEGKGSPRSEKTVPPSKARVRPLALEWQLLQHLAKARRGASKEARALAEKAAYLERTAGEGYVLAAAHPDRRPEDEHARMLERVVSTVAAMPLRETELLVEELYRQEKIRIHASAKPDPDAEPTSTIRGYAASLRKEIEGRKRALEALRASPAISVRGLVRGDTSSRERRIRDLERVVQRLEALERRVAELLEEAERCAPLKKDLLALADAESRRFRASELNRLVARFGESNDRVARASGVGTHQVRLRLQPAVRAEIEAKLAKLTEGAKPEGRGKAVFFRGDLAFLPSYWQEASEDRTAGDFRITEYLSGDEVFLTVFDSIGVFSRIVVLEWKGKIHVLVPDRLLEGKPG